MADCCKLIALIFALFFPPLSVLIMRGCSCDLLLNIVLTVVGVIPGIIHAFWVVLKTDKEEGQENQA